MRSRYFEERDFNSATLGTIPSFGWRSLLFGKELLDKGLKWMIGNGEDTLVWVSPWLDDGIRMKSPLMKNIFVDLDLKVSALIEQHSGAWNLLLLNQLFYPQDVELILKMKITQDSKDFKVWKFNVSGAYTTKSGYWLAANLAKSEVRSQAALLPSLNPLKKIIWDLCIPPKLRIFLWKILSAALPVANGLMSRGILVDDRCQFCGHVGESEVHLFFTCPLARLIWAVAEIPVPRSGFSSSSIYQNFNYLLELQANLNIPILVRKVFPWLLWRIWKNRNAFIFEGLEFDAISVVNKAFNDMNEWSQVQQRGDLSVKNLVDDTTINRSEWIPPPIDWKKCDIGVEWDKKNHICGAAWLLRDDKGVVLMHSRNSFTNVLSVMEAQERVWLWAIESMSSLHFSKIVFAAESKELVGAVTRPPAWPSFRWISRKILSYL
ncbi:uncharacterized protein LOC125587367 [Brassica napus]|uniref:uncharacterized protein LOC125587367 n=1 Tax=Brassica napus TaxID=3708 RepID=UPI0020796E9D|nr:uncharacterized protein LOC125587367 [Brassica napus]